MGKETKNNLSEEEIKFCRLLTFGVDPYAGNPRLCYEDIFNYHDKDSLYMANKLVAREDIKKYLSELKAINTYDSANMKARITENLLKIADEASKLTLRDRKGNTISPAAMRSVAVNADKALMDIYGIKAATENEIKLKNGDNGDAGITLNIIVPKANDNPK